ncbi:hypothetical protein PD885_03851 [Xanthomonas fragariae]|uniref:Secreted protein n=1 Tax=Xanthomonas fragariae TaxID=48664 RepID=A0ABY1RUW9_9XANT|nr:hypothetical protein PD885_03851 [Xanthomonas fragariae]
MAVSKSVFLARYSFLSSAATLRGVRVLPAPVSVRLAMLPVTPMPTFWPDSSSTGMMLILDRNSLDSCMRVSSFCCTVGSTVKEWNALLTPLSLAICSANWLNCRRVAFCMVAPKVRRWRRVCGVRKAQGSAIGQHNRAAAGNHRACGLCGVGLLR